MGPKNSSIMAHYQDKSATLPITALSFDPILEEVRSTFKLSKELSLTLKNPANNQYRASEYKWEEFVFPSFTEIEFWDQICSSVQSNNYTLALSHSLFKIIDLNHKILGLGLQISASLIICPKKILLSDDFQLLCNNSYIEFFNNHRTHFKSTGVYSCLGDHPSEQMYFICELVEPGQYFKLRPYLSQKRIKGNLVYFNKDTQMLEAQRITHIKYLTQDHISLNIRHESVPGAFFICDDGEAYALWPGGIGKLFQNFLFIREQFVQLIYFCEDAGEAELKGKLRRLCFIKKLKL